MNDSTVPAVILAAGEGRRLEPLTNRRPKPMIPVADRPILEYVVSAVADAGLDRIVLVVGYKAERIRNHFGDGNDWGIDIEYIVQETQLGTAHAVLQAEPAVNGSFLVLNGDRLVAPSLIARIQREIGRGDEPILAVTRTKHASDYGVVSLDDDRITAIVEKPRDPAPSELINAGVYGFEDAIFDAIRGTPMESGELAITTTLERMVDDGGIRAVHYRGRWLDVSNLWDLLDVNAAVIDDGANHGSSMTATSERDGAVAADTAIGTDVTIGANATIGGGTAVGDNVTIESNAVVSNAVVFSDTVIEAGAVVKDAIVASNARIGANTTIAGGSTTMVVEGKIHDDVELGGVVGDNATIGSAVTAEPGTVIGDGVTVAHGATVDGRIEPDVIVRRG